MEYTDLLVSSIFFIIPILICILFSKKYNIFHGVITYLFLCYIIYFLFNELSNAENIFTTEQSLLIKSTMEMSYKLIHDGLLLIPGVSKLTNMNENYSILAIVFIIYFILHIISSIINKIKIEYY
ncbi:MAG: hypothetical protein R3Y60_00910 [bacterium]